MSEKTILIVGTYDTKDDELFVHGRTHHKPRWRRVNYGYQRLG